MASLFDKILNNVGLTRKEAQNIPLSDVGSNNPFSVWLSEKKITADKAMRLYSGWVYACVRAISEGIAQIEFELYQIKGTGENATYEEVHEHEAIDLLNSANPFQSGYELKFLIASYLELTGNAYILLDGVSDENSKPTALYVLNPKYIKVLKAPLPEFIRGYEYKVDGTTKIYQPYEIIHIKNPDPNDPYEGVGTVQAIASWIDTENYATEVNRQYFLNGARLSGLLKLNQTLTPEQMDYMRKSFERVYKGAENAYKVGVLPQGTDYTELGNTPKDMDFGNLSNVIRDKICAGFRVPKTILGAAESETNRATAETAAYVFTERTIKPKIEMIVQQLNEKLMPRFGDNLVLGYDDPTPENREQEIAEMTAALGQGQAAMSINEARDRYLGLGPIDNGDAVMGNFSLQPIGEPTKKSTKLPLNIRQSKGYNKNANIKKVKDDMSKGIASKIAKEAAEFIEKQKQIKTKDITSLSDDEYEVVHKALLTRVTPFEKAITEKMREINNGQVKEVLENLPKEIKSFDKKDFKELFNAAKWVTIIADAITPIVTDVFKQEATAAAKLISIDLPNPVNQETARALRHGMELMADRYNETTVKLLEAKLTEAMNEGAGLDEMVESVNEIYEFANEVRAEMVARTETFRTANAATKDAWKQSGIVKTLKWYTAADERTCEFCGPLHGKVIGIDETFFDKGDTVEGSDGGTMITDYDTIENPPLHISCRCYIRPEKITLRNFLEANKKEVQHITEDKQIEEIDQLLKEYE